MSEVFYMKKLITDGEGKFNFIRLEAETEAEKNQTRDTYLAADYQDATEAEYLAESAERDARQGTEGGAEPKPEGEFEEETPAEPEA